MRPKKTHCQWFTVLLIIIVISSTSPILLASPLDIEIKIGRIDEIMTLMEQYSSDDGTGQGVGAQAAMLQGMFQWTDWIDTDRSIVIGITFNADQPEIGILIPFDEPNEMMVHVFGAVEGKNYYLMSLPPGQDAGMSKELQSELVKASKTRRAKMLAVHIRVKNVLANNEDQIQQSLSDFSQQSMQNQNQGDIASPQDIQEMLSNLIDIGSQLETLDFNVEVEKNMLNTEFILDATSSSDLYNLFTPAPASSLLVDYNPNYQINFKSLSYDVTGMMALLEKSFGKMYAKMGIDLAGLAEITGNFTGESAGGFSINDGQMQVEMIGVLNKKANAATFLEKEYLPWIEQYNRTMQELMEQELGQPVPPLLIRTEDSDIKGQKVVGIRFKIPNDAFADQIEANQIEPDLMNL
jgi:hypothetical protein